MIDKTEQKIMDAALKLFAKYGYKGATTRAIAEESGFNELTLFRRFKNKENLFYIVISQKIKKMIEDSSYVLIRLDNKFEDPRDFLKALIKDLMKTAEANFEIIDLITKERGIVLKISVNFIEEFISNLGGYIEKNIQNREINYKVLVFSMLSFMYLLLLDQGRTFADRNETIDEFINTLHV